jgi:hypothetical protein
MKSRKEMGIGIVLFVSFFIVLFLMWSPLFGEDAEGNRLNAFQAADNLFNSISKGSSYFMDDLNQNNQPFIDSSPIALELNLVDEQTAAVAARILGQHDVQIARDGVVLQVQGDLGRILNEAIMDSKAMYDNQGHAMAQRYGMQEQDARQITYAWYRTLKAMEKSLYDKEEFALGKHVATVTAKGVEVGYNFYTIEAESSASKAGILTFSLVFYVVYTLWWGLAIFFLFEGFGLKMTKGHKKEA